MTRMRWALAIDSTARDAKKVTRAGRIMDIIITITTLSSSSLPSLTENSGEWYEGGTIE